MCYKQVHYSVNTITLFIGKPQSGAACKFLFVREEQ